MNEKRRESFRNMFKVGTPECAVFFGVVAMVLALLFLTIGFWRTILVAALVGAGGFIGGVANKKEWCRGIINKLFPPKQSVPYREKDEEMVNQVRKATENNTDE